MNSAQIRRPGFSAPELDAASKRVTVQTQLGALRVPAPRLR
jgi:hypothetical protein